MRFNNKTCRFCLTEQNTEYGHKLEDVSLKSNADMVVQALHNVFGWQVKKSEPLTKICMECKATLLDVYLYVKKAKSNDKKWRKDWLKQKEVVELSSDEEEVQIKPEPVSESEDEDQDKERPVYNPSQYIKEEGETSDSDFEEKELIIECDVGPMVSSTTEVEDRADNHTHIKKEPTDSPPKKRQRKNGPMLRANRLTVSMRDWSTSESSSSSDSEVETVVVETPMIDLSKAQSPAPSAGKTKSTTSSAGPRSSKSNTSGAGPTKSTTPTVTPTTTTSTLACNQEIVKMGFDTLAEKMLAIKRTPNLTDDQMCKIFYGLKCHLCPDKDFPTLNDLESHFKDEHGITKISVKCCDIDIIKPIMVDHIKYHLGMQKSSLKDHIRRLQTMRICEECGLLFPSEKQLKGHIAYAHTVLYTQLKTRSFKTDVAVNITSGELSMSRYLCDICERPFYYECEVKKHRVKHLSLEEQLQYKRFECHDCGMKFYEKFDIQNHIEVIHAKFRRRTSGKVACLECNNVLSSMGQFKYHQTKHWTEEERQRNLKHKCDVCDKVFSMRSSLNLHQKIHSRPIGEQRIRQPKIPSEHLKCPHCEKQIKSKQHLTKHLHTHMTPEEMYELKKHECSTCTKRFWEEKALQEHIKFVHLKVYDYVCKVCNKKYVNLKNLKGHPCGTTQKIKSGKPEEKHECEFCGKVFNSPLNLKSHMYQWHLPGYIYECPTCKKGFNHNTAFVNHKLKCAKNALNN